MAQNDYYRTEEEFFEALGEAMRVEYKMIVDAGFLLQVDDPLGKIRELYALRDPLYREIADIVFEGDGRTPLAVTRQLEAGIRKKCEL